MPLRSPSSPLNLASSTLHVLRLGRAWIEENHPALPTLDLPSVALLGLMLQGSLTIMLRQAARVGVVGGGVQAQQHRDSPLLTLAQHHQLALGLIFLHCFHSHTMDAVLATPLGLIALAGAILMLAVLPAATASRVSAFWRRFFFLWPTLPIVLWSLLGYALPRYIFPATSGSGLAGWSIDPMGLSGGAEAAREAAREERAGAELCAYSWTAGSARSNSVVSTAALRVCVDLSLLCLIFSGLIYPLVECVREMSVKCGELHTNKEDDRTATTVAATSSAVSSVAASSASSVKQRKKIAAAASAATSAAAAASPLVEPDSDSDADDSSAASGSTSSTLSSLFAWSHMAALCMAATWIVSLVSLALAHELAEVLPAAASACPSLGSSGRALGAFEREAALLRDASCRLQWSRLSYAHTLLYASVGLLATLFSLWRNPLPVAFRTPILTMMAMSLWKGAIIAPCVVIATKCTTEIAAGYA